MYVSCKPNCNRRINQIQILFNLQIDTRNHKDCLHGHIMLKNEYHDINLKTAKPFERFSVGSISEGVHIRKKIETML